MKISPQRHREHEGEATGLGLAQKRPDVATQYRRNEHTDSTRTDIR